MIFDQNEIQKALKELSAQDFLSFGMHDVAYVREVEVDGRTGFAVHAADGTPLSVTESLSEANSLIHQNDLEAAIIH